MQELTCLIIEDEPLAAGIIRDYIYQTPGLKLNAVCEDVFAARNELSINKTDIIFADINLPGMSGIEFTQTLNNKYHIIFITAYHQFALDGFNCNAVDYLLKPVEYGRFLQAINKLLKNDPQIRNHIHFFNSGRKMIRVAEHDILYIESLRDNVKIHFENEAHLISAGLQEIHGMLKAPDFLRIHKSYIVRLQKISAFTMKMIEIGRYRLPIGRTYRNPVQEALKLFSS
jgi:two-component system LytT family response regulator